MTTAARLKLFRVALSALPPWLTSLDDQKSSVQVAEFWGHSTRGPTRRNCRLLVFLSNCQGALPNHVSAGLPYAVATRGDIRQETTETHLR
jgi:hypothetical protein